MVELHSAAGILTGTAHGAGEDVPLHDVALDGDRLTWKQSIIKPLRLNLAFATTVDGETMTGTSQAGHLGPVRFPPPAGQAPRVRWTRRLATFSHACSWVLRSSGPLKCRPGRNEVSR